MTATMTETEAKVVTFEDVARKAIELAEANPDFIYEAPETALDDGSRMADCVYVHEGKGSCLFGQALIAVGFDPDALGDYEDLSIGHVLEELNLVADVLSRESVAASAAQGEQDCGKPWGEAIQPLRAYFDQQVSATQTQIVTALDVAALAVELADASPEHVYVHKNGTLASPQSKSGCAYVHDRKGIPTGGCLFGRVLLGLGFEPEDIVEGSPIDAVLRHLKVPDSTYLHPKHGVPSTLAGLMVEAQMAQDAGESWGIAVRNLRPAVKAAQAGGAA